MSLENEVRSDVRAAVRWIVLDRPESRNGITLDVVRRLTELLHVAADDAETRVVVLAGANGNFCSGLDLKAAMSQLGDPAAGMATFHDLVRALRHVLKPTIAAIDGAAAGFGADLALGCDLRLGSTRARLGERFVNIGLMPDGGGTWFLPRLIGLGKAFELIYEGRLVEAPEALELGLVNRILPVDGFEDGVQAYAGQLAKGPPLAFAHAKAAILAGQGDLERSLAAEAAGQLSLIRSADFMEGVQAFLGKRPPEFRGR